MAERIFLAGHRGLAGGAILRALRARGGAEVLTVPRAALDLRDAGAVADWLARARPDAVILAAGRVGGIGANMARPAEFIADNLAIAQAVICGAQAAGVRRLVNLGSSCIYPRDAAQPIREEALMTGPLEPTNAPYALAKIAAIGLCQAMNRQHGTDYRSVMPANLYGPGDNFDAADGHVLPALLARIGAAADSGAAEVAIWGSGQPRREFLHADDLARGVLAILDAPKARFLDVAPPGGGPVNLGTGQEISIADLARAIARVTGFEGRLVFDPARPDGVARKCLDVSRAARLGFRAQIALEDGLAATWAWYRTARDRRGVPEPPAAAPLGRNACASRSA